MKNIVIKTNKQLKDLFKVLSEASYSSKHAAIDEKSKQDTTSNNIFAGQETSGGEAPAAEQKPSTTPQAAPQPPKQDAPKAPAPKEDIPDKEEITLDMIVTKINQIRSGHSFKDQTINSEMEKYFTNLNPNEKLALFAFLKGISQIVSGEVQGEDAIDPSRAPDVDIEMNSKSDGTVRSIKPTVVKKGVPSGPGKEDLSAPKKLGPIVPKQR